MTNSSAAPIMTCAKFLHHGGTHAQVHRTPDTRPSVPLRRRLLPATPGLPIRRQGHLRGPRDGPLRRRGAHLLHLRDLPPPQGRTLRGDLCQRPVRQPLLPRGAQAQGQRRLRRPPAQAVAPPAQAAAPPRRRPDPLALLRPALPGEPRDLPLPGQARDQLVLRLRHRLLGPPGPAVHLGRDSRDAPRSASRRYSRSCCSW